MTDPTTTCTVCGTVVAERPASWSLQVGERGPQWLCEHCTRENLRAIEGKLYEAWW
jgi:primosomal protein N'